jgi:hypothetical protein
MRLKAISCCKSPHAYLAVEDADHPFFNLLRGYVIGQSNVRSMIDAISPKLQKLPWDRV